MVIKFLLPFATCGAQLPSGSVYTHDCRVRGLISTCSPCSPVEPYLTNGFSHHYDLGESTFNFRGVRNDFYFLSDFFYEISLCKQNSPRWDAVFCGVTSGAMLFAYAP